MLTSEKTSKARKYSLTKHIKNDSDARSCLFGIIVFSILSVFFLIQKKSSGIISFCLLLASIVAFFITILKGKNLFINGIELYARIIDIKSTQVRTIELNAVAFVYRIKGRKYKCINNLDSDELSNYNKGNLIKILVDPKNYKKAMIMSKFRSMYLEDTIKTRPAKKSRNQDRRYKQVQDTLNNLVDELPEDVLKKLNGGIMLQNDTLLSDDGMYTLGCYHNDPRRLGRYITIYYGSFIALYGNKSFMKQKKALHDILYHELTHLIEDLAGDNTLAIQDQEYINSFRK